MIPVLILAGIDVVLGVIANVTLWRLRVARQRAEYFRMCFIDLGEDWHRLNLANAQAARRRSARARHARQCQIAQQRARKAEATAKLRGGR